MAPEREFDLVLFGATGFVGRLTAAELAASAPAGTRVALGGRSRERLEDVRAGLGPDAAGWEVVVADADDPAAMAGLAARTKVVVTTVGPYVRYGKALASACAASGTHYADLTGEVLFVRSSIEANHERAVATGARIVHSCGFDSVPSDLGVLALADRVRVDGEGELTETTLYVRSLKGGVSGGTVDSMRQQAIDARADATVRRALADPYSLSPDRSAEPSRERGPRPSGVGAVLATARKVLPVRRDGSGRWTAPFVMAGHNTRIVRRSNALQAYAYGRGFRYAEVTDCGRDLGAPVKAGILAGGLVGLAASLSFAPTRAVLDRFLPKPGEGPDEHAREHGRFVMDIETVTTTGARYRCRFADDRDPGYSGTAVMLGEAALCLALDDLPPAAGVLTPATAMGEALVTRLRARGLTIDVTRLP